MEIMKESIEIADFITASEADGPGIRSVLFLQGCSRLCPGCHNKSFQEHGKGIRYSIEELLDYLIVNCRNRKLTISGGEPMEQLEQLTELIYLLSKEGFDLCLYTSHEFQKIPSYILKNIRYLKTGAFLEDCTEVPRPYVGSDNQKFYRVIRKGGSICLLEI